jgi:hypothetical protein
MAEQANTVERSSSDVEELMGNMKNLGIEADKPRPVLITKQPDKEKVPTPVDVKIATEKAVDSIQRPKLQRQTTLNILPVKKTRMLALKSTRATITYGAMLMVT